MRQRNKERFKEAAPLVIEGIIEVLRVLKRQPPLEVFAERSEELEPSLDQPLGDLAWHVQARDLICLRSASYDINADDGWHDQEHCWIGSNRRSSQLVAIRCAEGDLQHKDVARFLIYADDLAYQQSKAPDKMELILAIRQSPSTQPVNINGRTVRKETESTLLENLVDFSDYYRDIIKRVEEESLPDSDTTLERIYTPSSCRDEDGQAYPDVEEYLRVWLQEPYQRHLALLGEYGQGKSTAALLTTCHIIKKGTSERIPVLLELRGKSPQHMEPEDLLAQWADRYRISGRAVMKLLIAGRIFLILEGFDEMALVGEAQARISHFRTLWKFAYPRAKVLITGRPNFFLDDVEMRAALRISKPDAAGPYCEAIYLQPFSIKQMRYALRASPTKTRDEIVSLAQKDAKFFEIVSRPTCLYAVGQLWEREKLWQYEGRITSAFVMELFIQNSYRRQASKQGQFMVLSESERSFFMSGAACYMGANALPNQITRGHFEIAVKRLYDAIPDSVSLVVGPSPDAPRKPLRERLKDRENPVQDVGTDVRSTGLLVRDETKEGAFRFAHKSFMEYLIGKTYAHQAMGHERETSAALMWATNLNVKHIALHEEMLGFLGQVILALLEDAHHQPTKGSLPVSKQLFEAIVEPKGLNQAARLYALFSLYHLKWQSRSNYWAEHNIRRRLVLKVLKSRFILFFIGIPFLIPTFIFDLIRSTLESRHLFNTSLVLLVLLSLIGFSLSLLMIAFYVMSNSYPQISVIVWLKCCLAVGLNEADIAATTGARSAKSVIAYAHLL